MATRVWLDVNTNWNDTVNWSGGAVPAAGDTARVLKGSQAIGGATYALGGALAKIEIGQQFVGSIGSAGVPLKFTDGVTTVLINAPGSGQIVLDPGACTTFTVRSCNGLGNGLIVPGSGTIATFQLVDAGYCRLSTGTYTTVLLQQGLSRVPMVKLDSGITLATLLMTGSSVVGECAIGTLLDMKGGEYSDESDTAHTLAEVHISDNGYFTWKNKDGVVSKLKVYKGTFDATQHDSPKTLNGGNDAECWAGGRILLANGPNNITVSNNIIRRGGKITGTVAVTDSIPEIPEA